MSLRATTQTSSPLGLIGYKTGVPVFLSQNPSTTTTLKQPLLFMTLPVSDSDVVMTDVTEKSVQRSELENPNPAEASDNQGDQQLPANETEQSATCVVCGDDGAKMHYNVLACLGQISRGDTLKDPKDIYPLHINTIKELIDNPVKLKGKRTEMRYEPYRMAKNEELSIIVYRRLIAAIDWVNLLAEMTDDISTDDKISLVKSCYAPLLLFKCSARTAMVTDRENILCLCNFVYVPKNIADAYSDTYHLDNGLVDRLINELVLPLRKLQLREEELVCLSAIIVLNPMAKDLSEEGIKKVSLLRDKIQDTLFQFIKETRGSLRATAQFGNFLLYLPILANLANVLCENLRFAQTFSALGSFPLLTSLFGCFPVEPFLESESENERKEIIRKNVEVQTDPPAAQQKGIKRRLPTSFVSPVENESSSESREFRLLRPPCSYTLTEMFEDRMNENPPSKIFQLSPQMTWPLRQQPQASSFTKPHYTAPRKPRSPPQLLPQPSSSREKVISYKHSIQDPCVSSEYQYQLYQNATPSNVASVADPRQKTTCTYNQYPAYVTYSNPPPVTVDGTHTEFSPPPPIEKLSFEHREQFKYS
ncbi:hypothetical protein FO519_003175 [Halicephalobus sp. NKZ332]|nr:hypothetical protein FO519_003175 [Halicephalobus sp. NKZ332]